MLIMKILQIHIPAFIRKKKIKDLFECTARAFECGIPDINGLSYEECLEKYALFTNAEAEKSIRRGDNLQIIKKRLYQNAFILGENLGKSFRVTTIEEVMKMSRILYNALKIDFHGNVRGDISIETCFFSKYYSSSVCEIISSLDEGIIAGLSGGGKLVFSERITEGKKCCKACFVLKDFTK